MVESTMFVGVEGAVVRLFPGRGPRTPWRASPWWPLLRGKVSARGDCLIYLLASSRPAKYSGLFHGKGREGNV